MQYIKEILSGFSYAFMTITMASSDYVFEFKNDVGFYLAFNLV